MRLLVVGGGGREHALAWKLARSPEVREVLCAPGNAGVAGEPKARCVPVADTDVDGLVRLALAERVDLVVVGPEAPLVSGLVDRLGERGVPAVGPNRLAARLEGSKAFAKELMARQGIPTAAFEVFERLDDALGHVRTSPGPWVVKADGLAAGKGVLLCHTRDEAEQALRRMLLEGAFGEAGRRVVIEELLEGEEASCIGLTDGERILLLASSQDHKRLGDGDRGPNTGGMGAYSPAPVLDAAAEREVRTRVFEPAVRGLAAAGCPFRGILYAGLMLGPRGPQVLEFNVRLGDPETQALLPRLRSDLAPALLAVARGDLRGVELDWDPRPAVCVVMAAAGYPGPVERGRPISGLERAAALADVAVFHAGTAREGDRVVTRGGRVLGVVGLGSDVRAAAV
ncbi:MAG TPA: phosphoribosylamine--glycine ligase, partial [Myxococcota bacterium]|nr:phosphoribosylamine--glycine ligase [Myxococcota bacterium]